jgi:GLPGLI family protein
MKYILILSFILFCKNIYSQLEGKALYSKKPIQIEKLDTIDVRMKKIFQDSRAKIEDLNYVLKFDKTKSVYKLIERLEANEDLSSKVSKILSGFTGIVYLDLSKDKQVHINEVAGKTFFVESSISKFDWKITDEKAIISNYVCFKAITSIRKEGRYGNKIVPIEAWFSPDINIQHGPEGFGGLPGLILKIKKENIITEITSIDFIKLEENIKLPTNKTISKKKFNKLMKDMNMNRRKYYQRN